MPKDARTKTNATTKTVSLPQALWDAVDGRWSARWRDRSDYFKYLVEKDLNGPDELPDPASPDVLIATARVLCGRNRAEELARHVGPADQPVILGEIIEDYLERLRRCPQERPGNHLLNEDPPRPADRNAM